MNRLATFATGLVAITCAACSVVVPAVLANRVVHSADDDDELCTHDARMFAIVSIRSRPSQLTGGVPPVQLASVTPLLLQKIAGKPVVISARLTCDCAIALQKPITLLDGAPMTCPVASVNCASAHSAATVVNSLITIDGGTALDTPTNPINPIAELLPSGAALLPGAFLLSATTLPPSATT